MKKTSEPIVFFGSGPVAAESLRLLAQDFTIEGVVTKPRPLHHRGDVPVLATAEKLGLKTYTASNKKELDDLFDTRPFSSRAGVLVDFGIIISQKVIDYFPLGIINSHFSVLPEWRGADPITFAVLSGQKKSGVSIMLLVAAMDEGPLLSYGEYELPKTITTPELTNELIKLSYNLLKRDLPLYLTDKLKPGPQDVTGRSVSYSRKLTKEDGAIDWNKSAVELEREIRAFAGWPKSQTILGGKEVTITQASADPNVPPGTKPGDTAAIKEAGVIAVTTGAGSLWIQRLKPSGKREMSAREFLAGNTL